MSVCIFYADDTQLYLSFEPGNTVSENVSVLQLEKCIGIIKNWMAVNKLKFNDEKTEFLIPNIRLEKYQIHLDLLL